MSRRIFTYTDLTKLNESNAFRMIKNQPIVTVSADLRKSLKGKMAIDKVDGIFSNDPEVRAIEFRAFSEAIDDRWNSDQTRFNQTIVLSEFIRMKSAGASDKEKNYYLGCRRNLNSMLAAISLVEQAQMNPEDITVGNDRSLRLFVDAWKYLLEHETSIKNHRAKMASMKNRDNWIPVLEKCFKLNNPPSVKRITFMNFYYITPLQESVMLLLEKAGYELDFLIPYDDRYPFVYEIWDNTYSVERGYPNYDEWISDYTTKEDIYAQIFEGKKVNINNKIAVKEYASVIEFVNEAKRIKEAGVAMYSADAKNVNNVLKEYYPELYGDRKILSYPIGQFISNLNRMWDDEKNTIVLDEDRLIECFSSGWLALDGESGKQYMQELFYILPFFSGCETIDEWEKRLTLLKNIDEDVIAHFRKDFSADESTARWQEACANPMMNFSPFAVQKESLDVIMTLIKQLLDMARELYSGNNTSDVGAYIQTLDRVLKKHEVSNELYEEEREKVCTIFEKLYQPSDIGMKCHPTDIANALSLFISGKLEDGEVDNKSVGMIYPFFFVDAACVKNNSNIHVCMCDVNTMPGGDKDYIWPLSEKCFKDAYEKTHNTLINNLVQIMSSTAITNRFFMYCAIKNDNVTLSWVSNMSDKLNAPSPYVKLICDAVGIEVLPAKRNAITYNRVAEAIQGQSKIVEYDRKLAPVDMVKEAKMAYALCPMKYILSYVVEKYPTYQSLFQQTYATNALISAIYSLMEDDKISKDQVYKNVISLFPNLRRVEKRQIKDYMDYDRGENDFAYGEKTKCGELYFTDERIKLHYPNRMVRELALLRYSKLMSPEGRQGMNIYEPMDVMNLDEETKQMTEAAHSACTFCPHINNCIKSVYAVDQEKFYD